MQILFQLRIKIVTNADHYTVISLQDSNVNIPGDQANFGSSVIDIKKPEWAKEKAIKLRKHIAIESTRTLRSKDNKKRLPCKEDYGGQFQDFNECVERHFEDENKCSLPWKNSSNNCADDVYRDYVDKVYDPPTFSGVYDKTGCARLCEQMVSRVTKVILK